MDHIKNYVSFLVISLMLSVGGAFVVQTKCKSDTQDKNAPLKDSNKLIMKLIRGKDIKQLEALLAHGVDINGDEPGNLPLWYAVQDAVYTGDTSVVKFLLSQGSNVNAIDSKDNAILYKFLHSLESRYEDCGVKDADYLKKQKATVIKLLKLLLEAGAVPDVSDSKGSRPLHAAIKLKSPEIIEMLIKHKANVNAIDKFGYTPFWDLLNEVRLSEKETYNDLYNECKSTFFKIAQLLIKAGADLSITQNTMSWKEMGPAVYAALYIEDPEWLELLLSLGVDISQRNWKGQTILHELFDMYGIDENKLALLFKYGAFKLLNTTDQTGKTPLDVLESSSRGMLNQIVPKVLVDELYTKKDLTLLDKTTAQKIFDYILASSRKPNTALDIHKSTVVLRNLSNRFNLKSFNPASVKYSTEDLLRVFDVSVVDDKVLDNPEDALPHIPADKPNKTQTEAYLSKPALRQDVIALYGKEIVKLPKLITRIIGQEQKFKDYYVFYHGQMRDFIVLYDVIKEIQSWFNDKKNIPEFEYVRFPEGQNKELNEYLLLGKLMDDTTPEMIRHLLSVNLSLFGSTGQQGSATFSYFLESRNMKPPKDLLHEIFTKLGLDTSYIPRILDTLELIKSPTGNLLQIFIPGDKVNMYTYLSVAFGTPLAASKLYTNLDLIKITDTSGKIQTYNPAELDVKTYLDIYKNHPEAVSDRDMDLIQGRINITEDFLLNPRSGVKIFRYNTVPPEKLLEYQEKLRAIIKEVMEDWKKKNISLISTQPAETITHVFEDLTSVIQE